MIVQLKEIAIISAGQGAPQGDENYSSDGIPFVKAGNLQDLVSGQPISSIQKVSPPVAEKHKLKLQAKGSVLFAKSGMSCLKGHVYVLPEDAYIVSHLACVTPQDPSLSEYLHYYFRFNKPSLLIKDAAYPSISLHDIGNMQLSVPDCHVRESLVSKLQYVENIINMYTKELGLLDNLIKSRFVEIFGDPVSNPKKWEKRPLSEEAEIKIGPFGSLLHKDDYIADGHALVNPSHILNGKIITDCRLTVSDDKYSELSAYHLIEGDVILGRRGEMGRCAVVEQSGLLCGTGSLIIRSKGDLSPDYIQKIISFPSFKRTIEDMAVGQTMPNLNVPIVSDFSIIKPPKNVQNQYYEFVSQIDKSKSVIQKALDETQLLFDSLMQEYFG